jgi:3-hydroxyisobutyrate dehydrogenase
MIAFIGLGNMGLPMATNLAKAGHDVIGVDVTPNSLDRATAQGVKATAALEEAVRGAAVVITMLPSGKQLVAVYQRILDLVAPQALVIDCSTVDVASSLKAHEMAGAKGLVSVDAPVSGGVSGAAAATLTFMAGGAAEAIEKARPLLEIMGRRVVVCGGPGAGQAAKTCNNMVLGISMVAIGEAFALGERLNLSHEALFEVLSTSSGQCWALTNHCPVPGPVPTSAANHDYKPGFAAALMSKDLGLARDAAAAVGVDIRLGRGAAELYDEFTASDTKGLDYAAVINLIRQHSEARS